jgi:hypothetical protein
VELILVVEAIPATLVPSVGLVLLVRRRAALERLGTVAIAGVFALLVGTVLHVALSVARLRQAQSTLAAGTWSDDPRLPSRRRMGDDRAGLPAAGAAIQRRVLAGLTVR